MPVGVSIVSIEGFKPMFGKKPLKATQRRRERHMNDDFGDRLSASANAKTAKLEMAAQAKIAAETPAAIAQRAEGIQVGDEEARG